ncbi:HTH-type transcriptional regulator DmlR [Pseudoruegeria aquimaris]|uniref:HTH-type transcriptional regulator DmlR n=1 Tax=Pseudoruegeria aquimaris TaxID=393663 RepID=A0A1Y5SLP9_9RHOB|nr:LysR family transcriptional regulator [Pseudoruegeria aquimaris]SLN43661.1 HTH-type transcriptional regulator DmlR [Pseudoruegeria aquimaris]
MKDDWDDLRAVLMVVRHGALARAAKALGVNYTTVARRIAQAEEAYGVRFFERLPAGYVPTPEGLAAAEAAEAMAERETGLRLRLAGQDARLSGPLTVTAPSLLIASHLCTVFDAFTRAHPDVELRVLAANEVLNLNRREADLAVRISNDPGDTLTGRRLAQQHTAAFAAPELAERLAAEPGMPLEWIGFTFWDGPPKASRARHPEGRVRLRFDDMTAVIGAAKAGLGVARMPVFVGRAAGLVQVPVMPPQPYQDIWMVAHRDVWPAAKVAAMRALIVARFAGAEAEFLSRPDR